MICQYNLLVPHHVAIMINRWVQVKEHWQVYRFVRVEQLVLKAEALYFIEVKCALFWEYLVYCDASYRFIRAIIDFIKSKGCLTSIHKQLSSFWLEFPWDFILCMAHEAHSPLSEDVYLVFGHSVVFGMLAHCEAEGLADDVVEGHGEEVASEEQQAEAIDTIEFAPLGLLLEHLVDLYGLATLSHLDWQ